MFESLKAREQKRESLRRNYTPDPGFWVRFMGNKFFGDANIVWAEGHEDDFFAFPGEIKILQAYPDGVRVLDGFGDNYLLFPFQGAEPKDFSIRPICEAEARQRDQQWKEFYEQETIQCIYCC